LEEGGAQNVQPFKRLVHGAGRGAAAPAVDSPVSRKSTALALIGTRRDRVRAEPSMSIWACVFAARPRAHHSAGTSNE
jgi:hypothetical protein